MCGLHRADVDSIEAELKKLGMAFLSLSGQKALLCFRQRRSKG